MTLSQTPKIPYEGQRETVGRRMCGAAALCMVYRSLGLACTQEEVWDSIARQGPHGAACARTYLLARDALGRGLSALTLQALDPWPLLQHCLEQRVRVILNHRLAEDNPAGHYSVVVDAGPDQVVVHDPHWGPDRLLSRDALLRLWRPLRSRSEVTGHVLVALARDPTPAAACGICQARVPERVCCAGCGELMAIQPAVVLGCPAAACRGRRWNWLFCPSCDCRIGPPLVAENAAQAPSF